MPTDAGGADWGTGFDYTNDLPAASASTATPSGYLPNGHYNVYKLSQADYNKQLFLGTVDTNVSGDGGAGELGGLHGKNANVTTGSYRSVEDYMRDFANMSINDPQTYSQIQGALYQSGAYGSKKPVFGTWSSNDGSAMYGIIQDYLGLANPDNPNPISFQEYLQTKVGAGAASGIGSGGGGGGGSSRAPLQLTDPAYLKQTLSAASQNVLHRDLSPDELDGFVNAFHSQEQQAYNGSGVNPDPSAQALTSVQTNHADEASDALKSSYNDTLMQLLGAK